MSRSDGTDRPPDGVVHPYTGQWFPAHAVPDDARIALLEVALDQVQSALTTFLDTEEGSGPSRWSWRHADPDVHRVMGQQLRAFVDWLIERYQPTATWQIMPCWYRHPVATEELWGLMAAWQSAYHGTDKPTERLISWHQQYLWPTLERLTDHAGWRGCGNGHKPPTGTRPATTDPGITEYLTANGPQAACRAETTMTLIEGANR